MPDPAFAPFTGAHFAALGVGAAALAGLILLGRRGGGAEKFARGTLAFVNLAAYGLTQWAWMRVQRDSDLDFSIPLHLCDLAAVLAGFALITGNRTAATLTYFWGLAGTIQGIATPAIDIGPPHPAFFSFFVHHFAVVGAALYLPLVLGWRSGRPWWRAPLVAFAWLQAYLLVALAANAALGTNFGFLARKPVNPSLLDHLGPHPFYIGVLELIAVAFFLLLTLPVRGKAAASR